MVEKSEFRSACPNCGWWVPKALTVDNCTKCGHSLLLKPPPSVDQPAGENATNAKKPGKTCTTCGWEAPPDWASYACDNCMRPLPGGVQKKEESLMAVVFWMMALACGGVGLILATSEDTPKGSGPFYIAVAAVNFALFAGVATVVGHLHSIDATLRRMERHKSH